MVISLRSAAMYEAEQIEKVRQAIMRYRELLDVLKGRVASSERAYAALFTGLTDDQRASLPEKQQQREAALIALDDPEPLRRAVLAMRLDARDIEQAFEELYDRLAEIGQDAE
jgi:hypothetical protein